MPGMPREECQGKNARNAMNAKGRMPGMPEEERQECQKYNRQASSSFLAFVWH
jgi:hypothetical protein